MVFFMILLAVAIIYTASPEIWVPTRACTEYATPKWGYHSYPYESDKVEHYTRSGTAAGTYVSGNHPQQLIIRLRMSLSSKY